MLGSLITVYQFSLHFHSTVEFFMPLPAQSLSKAGEYKVVTTSNLF